MIYLDNAATSFLKPPCVSRAVYKSMLAASSPGRGGYPSAMRAAEIVYACREAAAALFHMEDPTRVVITGNATHALNIAIHSLVKPGDPVVISGFEHNAVTRPLRTAGAKIRVAGRRLFAPEDTLQDFRTLLPGAKYAVCTHVSNVFGYVLPIAEIATLCREHGVRLIVDASQSAGVLDINAQELGAAFIAMPGHKSLFGPQGTGLLLCGEKGLPLMQGGAGFDSGNPFMPEDLPERLEAGTMNVPGIAGLLEGIRYVGSRGTQSIAELENKMLQTLIRELSGLPGLRLFYGAEGEQSGILSFCVEHMDSETVSGMLSERGFAVRGGLHCAPLAHESAGTREQGTVRVSVSPFLDDNALSAFIRAMEKGF